MATDIPRFSKSGVPQTDCDNPFAAPLSDGRKEEDGLDECRGTVEEMD